MTEPTVNVEIVISELERGEFGSDWLQRSFVMELNEVEFTVIERFIAQVETDAFNIDMKEL